MSNVVLIGMPGVGKSTVGVILAKVLGYHFVDADILIQEQEGRLLREIIEEDGVDGFIEIENRVNSRIQEENAVIATGGSVVYGKDAMENLSRIGTVVYLQLDYIDLFTRLGDLKGRGVVLREGQTLRNLFDERTPLYDKYADIVVNEAGLTVEETLEAVVEGLKKLGIAPGDRSKCRKK
ncbi:shikimate kinase [Robinsoniella sp. RHS]|uniref:shikimate kinase n=1 Tax=Robinsoniella sp. RHS TaxID=1504536 RepID=UPI000AEDBA31